MPGGRDDVAWRLDRARLRRRPVRCNRLVILEPALVTAQPLLDPLRRLVGAGIGIRRHGFGFEHDAGIEMDHAFGPEAEAFLADRDMAGKAAVEIFCGGFRDPLADARTQGLAYVNVPARDAKRHDRPPL